MTREELIEELEELRSAVSVMFNYRHPWHYESDCKHGGSCPNCKVAKLIPWNQIGYGRKGEPVPMLQKEGKK
jgi:hypothetical protein